MTAINQFPYTSWSIKHVTLDGSTQVVKTFTSFDKAIEEYQIVLRGRSHKNVELFPIEKGPGIKVNINSTSKTK
tara:strand:- start:719 stop:940 length:222 start_codon:yes stop_codon:yes gene_type:complete